MSDTATTDPKKQAELEFKAKVEQFRKALAALLKQRTGKSPFQIVAGFGDRVKVEVVRPPQQKEEGSHGS
jgi:hypothetical protein